MTLVPTITAYGGTGVPSSLVQLIGSNFGRVSSCALVDSSLNQYECDFQVERGNSIQVTIPKTLSAGTYMVVLGDLDNVPSVNTAGLLTVVAVGTFTPPAPPPVPDPIPTYTTPAMVAVRARTRWELGDMAESFQVSVQGDGVAQRFDIPYEVIDPTTTSVSTVVAGQSPVALVAGNDYVLDSQAGIITTTVPLPVDTTMTITGNHFQFFADSDLDTFIFSALLKHTNNQTIATIWRDVDGYKHYDYAPQIVDTLAPVEYHPVALLAAIECLEVIRTDAGFDIDVTTAEGTTLPRSQRYANIGEMMQIKQMYYDDICRQLGVGLARIEVFNLQRVSRTTGRLVPNYVDREYDDFQSPPMRIYPGREEGVTGTGFDQVDPYAYSGGGYGGNY